MEIARTHKTQCQSHTMAQGLYVAVPSSHQTTLWTTHNSQREPSLSSARTSLQLSGTSLKTLRTSLATPSSKLSSQDARTQTQELEFMLALTTPTTYSHPSSTESFSIITSMERAPSMSLIWTLQSSRPLPLHQKMLHLSRAQESE